MKATQYWKLVELKPGMRCLSVWDCSSIGGDCHETSYVEILGPCKGDSEAVHIISHTLELDEPSEVDTNRDAIAAILTDEEWQIAERAGWPPTLGYFLKALREAKSEDGATVTPAVVAGA